MTRKNQIWNITPRPAIFKIRLRNLCPYRYLFAKLIQREITSFYRQTLLGPLWFFIQPLLTTSIFVFTFGKLTKIPTDGIPPPLFYLSGIIIWNYFTDCINKTAGVFKDNLPLFSKIYFPRIIMPLSTVTALLMRFGIQLSLFITLLIFYRFNGFRFHLNSYIFLFPLLIINTAALGLGIGLLISALTIKYRDLNFLIAFGIQLMMYATTVIFPLSATPKHFRKLLQINPVTNIIETFRYALFSKGLTNLQSLISALIISAVILFCGIIAFKRAETNFIDNV
ncbi:ABC transporter permease [Pedobacter frigoris]|uniref:Transport permease protein n=1 Tax=Pedobacter frigoris TaxID=2571272 RepID=A0A4U1CPE7_9SPHI|nr:ABC transporter permease [Pedobacter frigoris]TKC08645.1 ABC transporter permease [Pedobacter frigoris]